MTVRERAGRLRTPRWAVLCGPLAFLCIASPVPSAQAAGPPIVVASWTSAVASSSARLGAQIDPNGLSGSYHFDYITEAKYEANGATFAGAARIPPLTDAHISAGNPVTVSQPLFGLSPDTAYRYRVVATNSDPASPTTGSTHAFTTQSLGGGALLPDSRGWEMVSPVDKNGGQIDPPGTIAAGGVLQAAAGGGAVTYGSEASFGAGAQGAPPASQYVSSRGAGGWSSENITAPIFSGTYGSADQGVPYQLFSGDLARALLLNGEHCRGGDSGCAVANPPLAGTDAPAGYQDYYLRDNATASFTALLGAANIGYLDLAPADFDLRFAGASADLNHVVLSSCAAFTADATEVPQGSGCDPSQQNLYEWSSGGGLSLLNLLPGQPQGNHHAALAAQSGAVSTTGARVYWSEPGGNLYLREGGQTKQVDADAGGGGTFETASADGSVAFFTVAGHLWRYQDGTGHATDLTPSGGITGVLGASDTGSDVYYQDASGLQRWSDGAPPTTTEIAPGAGAADPSDYHPATATARISADGSRLLFVSSAFSLTGYDNTDLSSPALCGALNGICDSEVYLYDASAATPLTCVSCNPTNERPIGSATIPGAVANGTAAGSTDAYKPRVLSTDGRRVFFDSRDALSLADANSNSSTGAGIPDVYQWEAAGVGSCARSSGCVALISSGRSAGGASFVDASADGADAFFLTDDSLVSADPGSVDLYDARIGGGFPVPSSPILCEGDVCQNLPSPPVDPTLDTLLSGPGNPAVRYVKHCKRGSVKRKGKCVKTRPHKRHGRRSHRRAAHPGGRW